MKSKNKQLRCFIASSINQDINNLIKILEEYNIEYYSPLTTINLSGLNIQAKIRNEIKNADFIIAIMSDNKQNVIYEIGLAHGMNKNVFVIIPDKSKPPSDITDTLYLRTDLRNTESIKFALDPFLKSLDSKRKKRGKTNLSSKLLKIDRFEINDKLEKIRLHGNESQLLEITHKVFNNLDAKVNAIYREYDIGADMSVWLDELENLFGNPILIELKMGHLSKQKLLHTVNQMEKYLERTNAKAGIILYLDKEGNRFSIDDYLTYNILIFEISDFIHSLFDNTIRDIVQMKRNKIVHSEGD